MHSVLLLWPALILVAGATVTIPAVQDTGNRSLLYWVILPSLVMGAAAFVSRFGGF